MLTLSAVLVPGAAAPAARAQTGPVTLPVTPPTITRVGPSAQARLTDLIGEQDALGSSRLVVDWGTLRPLQDRPVSIRGSAPVPSNGASRWVYLEERVVEDGVWGYVKDTRTNALGKFRPQGHPAPGQRAPALPDRRGQGARRPVGGVVTGHAPSGVAARQPATKTYPGLSVTWPGTRVLVGSRQPIQGTLASRPSKGIVTLQRLVAEQWTDVASSPVTGSGSFTLSLPTAYLTHGAYRLHTTGSRGEAVETPAEPFVVVPAYTPGGRDTSPPSVPADPGTGFDAPEPLPIGYTGAGSASSWTYLFGGGGRWNPCQVIRWAYNPASEGYAALSDVQQAFAKIAGVSELRFRYVGASPWRYGSGEAFPAGQADIVVGWADEQRLPVLAGNVVGYGGGSGRWAPAGADVAVQIERGFVVLDNGHVLPGGFTRSGWGQIITHEALHALGLGHASESVQIMYGTAHQDNIRFGAGDLTGMRTIGAAPGCLG